MPEEFQVTKRDTNPEKRMPFWEHVEELRQRLLRSLFAIMVFAVVAFLFKSFIFDFVIFRPKDPDFITNRLLCQLGHALHSARLCINSHPIELINIDLAGQFKAHLLVSFMIGLALAFPYLIWQLWLFVRPALRYSEKISIRTIMWAASLLFTLGLMFGYYIISPLAINFLSTYQISQDLANRINFQSYLSVLLTLTFSSGLVFELPILVYFLAKTELVTSKMMVSGRKVAIVVIFLIAAILTPPDVFSQILLAIPLLLLYELSISIARRVERKREKEIEVE